MFWESQLDELTRKKKKKKKIEPQRGNCNISAKKMSSFSSSGIQQCGSSISRGFSSDVETIEQRRNMYRSPDKEEA